MHGHTDHLRLLVIMIVKRINERPKLCFICHSPHSETRMNDHSLSSRMFQRFVIVRGVWLTRVRGYTPLLVGCLYRRLSNILSRLGMDTRTVIRSKLNVMMVVVSVCVYNSQVDTFRKPGAGMWWYHVLSRLVLSLRKYTERYD